MVYYSQTQQEYINYTNLAVSEITPNFIFQNKTVYLRDPIMLLGGFPFPV